MSTNKDSVLYLSQTPIFYDFLQRLFAYDGTFDNADVDFDSLQVSSVCKCGEKECATVYLCYKQEWDDSLKGTHCLESPNGIIIAHFRDFGYLEFEALAYENYPYWQEVRKAVSGHFPKKQLSQQMLERIWQAFCLDI